MFKHSIRQIAQQAPYITTRANSANVAKKLYYVEQSYARWETLNTRLDDRKRQLRAAHRRFRRLQGLPLSAN
jgi:hypothetical protein